MKNVSGRNTTSIIGVSSTWNGMVDLRKRTGREGPVRSGGLLAVEEVAKRGSQDSSCNDAMAVARSS